jgi:hypothetical protein
MDEAVQSTVTAGVPVVAAAMSDVADACDGSPARTPVALTVGATGINDRRADFSNYGKCIDLFAPGVGIRSSVQASDSAYESWDGASMATPHVTGVPAICCRCRRSPPMARSRCGRTGHGGTLGAGDPSRHHLVQASGRANALSS